jgi:hypothetical protein
MERFIACTEAFSAALIRAREMLDLFDALKLMKANQLVCDDALRAAWIQMVSSFDYHNHEVFAIEAAYRHANSIAAKRIAVPLEILAIKSDDDRQIFFDQHYRESISYKSFVSYDKILEAAACFTDGPAAKIVADFNSADGENMSGETIKSTLNSIWNRRNRIAHEADINPTMAGVELWPIYRDDVAFSISFVERLAQSVKMAIAHVSPQI